MPRREAMWERLGGEVDVLVIGGGIVGCGIARDAARRGLSVALVEMRDLAAGTSSRSSKLVHGGLRYLEQYELGLVFESVSERRILMDLAPHLVNPIGFLFPVYEGAKHKLWVINAGMWLYDGLSLFRSPKTHKTLRAKDVERVEPAVKREGLKGAPLFYDCSTDDARLTLENAIDAAAAGATIATWCRAESLLKDERGRVRGAVVKNVFDGSLKEVSAHAVVNATGPWADRTMAMSAPTSNVLLRPTKGVHAVVDHARLPINHVITCHHPRDERVLFAIPWGDRTYLGTTDTDFEGDPSEVYATREDVEYLLEAANAYFPKHQLEKSDVISTWAGIRPLIAPSHDSIRESSVSREHEVLVGQDGMITIAGGKLTTFRRMAAEVVDTTVRLLKLSGALRGRKIAASTTDEEPLPGGVGWPEDDDHEKVAEHVVEASSGRISLEVARHLAGTYGMRALDVARLTAKSRELAEPLVEGRPEIAAQVDFAVEEELAASLGDVMSRRTQLFYRDRDQGLGVADRIAGRMGALLGWDDARRRLELDAYSSEVAATRKWRDE